jgi:serine/threonine-protein kinase
VGTVVTFRVARPPAPPLPVPVPNFYLRTKPQALAMAALAGLALDVQDVVNPAKPVGRVYAQSIAAGTVVPIGTAVAVKVAKHPPGPPKTKVPSLVGKTAAQANAALAEAGLGADAHKAFKPGKPLLRVYAQDPDAGTVVPLGSVVSYTVATHAIGPKVVPDVFGLTKAAAQLKIHLAGLTADFDDVATALHPAGRVYAQSPAAGAFVPSGTVVHAKVAKAGPGLVLVPNLIGLTPPQAAAALAAKELGSQGTLVPNLSKPPHKVYSQSRSPGSFVTSGTVVKWRYNP